MAKHVLTAQSTRSPCTHVMAKRWRNGVLIPSFLLPRKKKKRASDAPWAMLERQDRGGGKEKAHSEPAPQLLGLSLFHRICVFDCFRGRKT